MSIDTVHSQWRMDALTDWAISIWKCGTTRCLFRVDRFITGRKSPVFLGTRNCPLKKPTERLLWTGSMAPFSSRLSTAFCRTCFFFLVGNCMGLLVKGGWWDSHCNRTPNRWMFDDLHSPGRFCHRWTKPARRAPTYSPSLAGTCRRSSGIGSRLLLFPVVAMVPKKLPLDLFCCPVQNDCWLPPDQLEVPTSDVLKL